MSLGKCLCCRHCCGACAAEAPRMGWGERRRPNGSLQPGRRGGRGSGNWAWGMGQATRMFQWYGQSGCCAYLLLLYASTASALASPQAAPKAV